MVHAVWMFRNSVVHEAVEEKLTQKMLDKLNQDIEHLYSLGAEAVCPVHRYLFDEGITATKERTARQKKYWIRTLQVSSEYRSNVEKNMFIGMRTIMRRWTLQPD